MNKQFINVNTKDFKGYILLNGQEKTYFKVVDKNCIEMLDHLYILRIFDELSLQRKLEGLREVETIDQFDGSEEYGVSENQTMTPNEKIVALIELLKCMMDDILYMSKLGSFPDSFNEEYYLKKFDHIIRGEK